MNSNTQGTYIRDTFNADKNKNRNDASYTKSTKILETTGEPPTLEAADKLSSEALFFDERAIRLISRSEDLN